MSLSPSLSLSGSASHDSITIKGSFIGTTNKTVLPKHTKYEYTNPNNNNIHTNSNTQTVTFSHMHAQTFSLSLCLSLYINIHTQKMRGRICLQNKGIVSRVQTKQTVPAQGPLETALSL